MATTFIDLTGDGNNNKNFSFASYQVGDIKVEVDNVVKTVTTHYNVTNYTTTGGGTIVFTSGNIPAAGAAIRIYRDTDVDSAKATFQAGSSVKAADLNNNQTQLLYASQEEQNQTVTTSRIKDGAVTSAKLSSDAITGAAIADDTINSEHYAAGSIDLEHMSANSVDSDQYVDGSIDHVHLANDIIDSDNIQDNAINSEHYVDGSIDHVHLANDSVDGDNIADDAIDSEHYTDGSIDLAHLASGSVDSTKMTAATVVTASEQASASANDTSFFTTSASDARYFNISSGDTIKDGVTFPDNDTTIATTAAINDRIIDLVDDVGGFVPIANETSFPTANPDVNNGAGTLVSIKALASNLTSNGSGVATIANGAGSGNTVTINGLANSTTYTAGFGMIVETTTTLHTYSFHRQVPKATEVTTVAGSISNVNTVAGSISNVNTVAGDIANINTTAGAISNVNTTAGAISNVNTVASNISNVNNFAELYQIDDFSPSAPTTDGGGNAVAEGDLAYDSTANRLKVYTGSAWEDGVTAPSDLISKNTVDAKGDLITGSADNTVVRTAVGTNGKFLKADSSAAGGVSWDTVTQTDTTYSISCVDGDNSDEEKIRLTAGGSGSGTDDVVLEAGTGLSIARDGDKITFTNTVSDTNTNVLAGGTITGDVVFDNATNAGKDLTWDMSDDALEFADNVNAYWGAGNDLRIFHNGTNSYIQNQTGNLVIAANRDSDTGGDIWIDALNGERSIKCVHNGAVELYYDNAKKAETVTGGFTVTGVCTATSFAGDGSSLTGVSSSVADGCIWENDQTISNNYTIASGKGAHSVGPITVNATVTVNGNWVIS